jgi:hypothetical protein
MSYCSSRIVVFIFFNIVLVKDQPMPRGNLFGIVTILLCSIFAAVGCGGGKPMPPKANGDGEHTHSHAEHGPHGGQVLGLGDEEYHAEFVLDEASGKVTVYLLDKDIKTNAAAASAQETIAIEAKSGEETKTYELAAVNRTAGDMPTAQQFELVDKELHGPIETNLATLKVTIAGKEFVQKINFESHGHGH